MVRRFESERLYLLDLGELLLALGELDPELDLTERPTSFNWSGIDTFRCISEPASSNNKMITLNSRT